MRNRLKIEATIDNAKAYLALSKKRPFGRFIWAHLPDGPIIHRRASMKEVPPQTDLSKQLSKALKAEGFRFVGPTTVYAFMQSSGMVNDHLVTCHRHAPCAALQAELRKV